jgi:plasmid stabilization system protein ParE
MTCSTSCAISRETNRRRRRGFVDKLEQQCEFLARFPESGTKRDDLASALRLFTFRGYGIYFRNLDNRVRIERVLPPGLDILQESFDE